MEVEEVSGHGLVRKKIRFLNSLILFMENRFLADPTHANDFLSFLSLPVSFSQLCAKLCRSVLLFYAIWKQLVAGSKRRFRDAFVLCWVEQKVNVDSNSPRLHGANIGKP
ncbi:hypothetical protein POTOM_036064 [Populus tomentosa]|uniref:Uncharacterized protein n=1 Tax=Populus tomentosa TaxID=118781 RepID=A0A8X7YYV5_POPTO|nr:hypothetical protein POTOM_036064 [Populus tomentosa]